MKVENDVLTRAEEKKERTKQCTSLTCTRPHFGVYRNWLISHFHQVIERPQYLSFEVLEVLQQLIVEMFGESALVLQQTQQLRAQILSNLLDFHSNRLEIVEATVL